MISYLHEHQNSAAIEQLTSHPIVSHMFSQQILSHIENNQMEQFHPNFGTQGSVYIAIN